MSMIAHVTKLINDIGKALTLRNIVEGAYDPATGAAAADVNTDTTIKGMFLNYKDSEFKEGMVQRGDRKVAIRASDSVVPANNDIILDGSVEYKIINITIVEEAGVDLVYFCQVRQ